MSRPTKKQIKITAALMGASLHGLDELARPYAVVVDGIDKVFTNVDPRLAMTLLRDAIEVQEKVHEADLEARAEANSDRQLWGKLAGGDEDNDSAKPA